MSRIVFQSYNNLLFQLKKMLKQILQSANQAVITPFNSKPKIRNSQKSQFVSTNSISLASSQNIDSHKMQKMMKRQIRTSKINLSKNKNKLPQQNQAENLERHVLQQKMQNVSCLYSNFIYKNTKKNFIQDMKLQRYRILMENERIQKNQLLKQIQQMKHKISQIQKQKQTVMFAYRALQAKIKQKQKRLKIKSGQKKTKLSINFHNTLEINPSQMSINQGAYQAQLRKTRQLLQFQGIVSLNQNQLNKKYFMQSLNKFCSSRQLCKYLENQDGINEWQEKQKRYKQMQKQIQLNKEFHKRVEAQNTELKIAKKSLNEEIKFYKNQYSKANQLICQKQQQIEKIKGLNSNLHKQLTQGQYKFNQINLKFLDQQKQDQKKQIIIKQLQNTKYSYLMKQEKQRQQVQLLKKFTQNLQLNDDKINEFIKLTFGPNTDRNQVQTENKLFKEDISYILHLIKKKQNIYNELIKQYQDKNRQTETRCFLIEKKMHFTDIFIKKIQDYLTQDPNQNQSSNQKLKNQDKHLNKNELKEATSKQQNKKQQKYIKIRQYIKTMIQSFKLDRRII